MTINLGMRIMQFAHENGSGNEGNDGLAARHKYPGDRFCHGWGRDVALEDASFSASWASEGWRSPSEKVSVLSTADQWHCPTGQAGVALSWHGEGDKLEGNTFSLSFLTAGGACHSHSVLTGFTVDCPGSCSSYWVSLTTAHGDKFLEDLRYQIQLSQQSSRNICTSTTGVALWHTS